MIKTILTLSFYYSIRNEKWTLNPITYYILFSFSFCRFNNKILNLLKILGLFNETIFLAKMPLYLGELFNNERFFIGLPWKLFDYESISCWLYFILGKYWLRYGFLHFWGFCYYWATGWYVVSCLSFFDIISFLKNITY